MLTIRHAVLVTLVVLSAAAVHAQEEPPPFIEPMEMHRHDDQTTAMLDAAVNPALQGRWVTLTSTMPINPVHMTLLRNSKVLVIAGSGNNPDTQRYLAGVWDPNTQTVTTFPITWDMFCNGMVTLPDGRPFVFGGTIGYQSDGPPAVPFRGHWRASVFRPAPTLNDFADLPRMRHGRWYPTGTVLADGTVMVISGLLENGGGRNREVEIYNPTTNRWRLAGNVSFSPLELYPRQHLLPDGRVFISGSDDITQFYNPATGTFTAGPRTTYAKPRHYGASVLLPLTPADNFRPKVILFGGGQGGVNTTESTDLIDLGATPLRWKVGPPMKQKRMQVNATILPNGKVLVSGGSTEDEKASTAVLATELYDPVTNTFSDGAPMRVPRLYHSNTLLLADGTVMAAGSNPGRTYEHRIEIYSPPYLFNSSGGAAVRPTISSSPATAAYNSTFAVQSPDAASIRSIVLVRPGAPTHSFDMEQRLVGMTFTTSGTTLTVRAPANSRIAPPGYYMLFVLNAAGVPSVARFIRLQ